MRRSAYLSFVALLGLASQAQANVTARMPLGLWLYTVDLTAGNVVPVVELSEVIPVSGITWTGDGELLAFVAGDRLVAIDPDTGQVSTRATFDLGTGAPLGLAADACGRLFLATFESTSEVVIRQLDPGTGSSPVVATLPPGAFGPLAAHGTSLFMIRRSGGPPAQGTVLRIEPDTGAILEVPTAPLLDWTPRGLDLDPQGRLWLTWMPPPMSPPQVTTPVHRIDLLTGAVTDFPELPVLEPFAIAPAGGLCSGGQVPAIPALSPFGALGLAAGLAAAGAILLARRHRLAAAP